MSNNLNLFENQGLNEDRLIIEDRESQLDEDIELESMV